MIALGPIVALIIQFGPAVITLLSQIIGAWQGSPVPVVGDHPLVAGLVSGLFLPHPVRRK